jgi:hypothetical protein|tara:strand:- start:1167 stop:1364 length:198 start_codon:yes stop_codon:yes gene_type:complete
MLVNVFKEIDGIRLFHKSVEMADTLTSLREICKSHSDGTDTYMHVASVHNHDVRKYKTTKIESKL